MSLTEWYFEYQEQFNSTCYQLLWERWYCSSKSMERAMRSKQQPPFLLLMRPIGFCTSCLTLKVLKWLDCMFVVNMKCSNVIYLDYFLAYLVGNIFFVFWIMVWCHSFPPPLPLFVKKFLDLSVDWSDWWWGWLTRISNHELKQFWP